MKNNTKEKLIETGIKAMLEKSYHSVGIKQILDTVGVPKGSFYHYFKSKEDFGVQVIDAFAKQHALEIQGFLEDRSITPMERLKASYMSCLKFYPGENGGCLVAKLSHEVAQDEPNMRAAILNAFDMWQSLYARMIREAQAAGEIATELNADELARFMHNAWEGAVMMMQVRQNFAPIKNYLEFVFKQLLNTEINFNPEKD